MKLIGRLGLLAAVALLCQCHSMKSDCAAIAQREALIAKEVPGDYYVGRRYYIPSTRFWGYLRRPGQSWRSAKLVIMDERFVHTPDRGLEPPLADAVFGSDANMEYIIKGQYGQDKAYEPNSNQVLPVFVAKSFTLRDKEPGFLFRPSEEYSSKMLTLFPYIMPRPQDCAMLEDKPQSAAH